MKKRLLSAVLGLTVLLGTLTGCSGGQTVQTDTSKASEQTAQVTEAPSQTEENLPTMAPGSYTATARGFSLAEPLEVTVTVSEKEILSVEVNQDNAETPPVFAAAMGICDDIVENQSVGVDTIAGATLSSSAIRTASEDALKQAFAAGGGEESDVRMFWDAPEKSTVTEAVDVDVVIVGMGGAGLTAMTRTAEIMQESGREVSVLAIEKNAFYGGNSLMASDFFAVNPEQHIEKYNDGEDFMDADVMRRVWNAYTEGDAKPELVDVMIDRSGETLDWLEFTHGYEFTEKAIEGFTGDDHYAGKFQYLPNDNGAVNKPAMYKYFTNMVDAYEQLGGNYLLETKGTELIYDEATNTVTGVLAEKEDGTVYEIHAKAVVLATGGFASNGEMTETYLSNEYYPLKGSWHQLGMPCNGEMIQSAIDIGAGTYNIGTTPIVHLTGVPYQITGFEDHVVEDKIGTITDRTAVWSENDIPKYLAIYPYTVAVNIFGERFATEDKIGFLDSWKAGPYFYSLYSQAQIDEIRESGFDSNSLTGPSIAWLGYREAVPADYVTTREHLMALPMSDRYVTAMPDHTPITAIDDILQAGMDAGFIYKADTLQELAEILGIDPSALTNTIEKYNSDCEAGVDSQFGKAEKYLRALDEEGPYYAVTGCAYCYATSGGLDVNENLQVLMADGETVINGLYATGSDCSGVLYTEKKAYVTYGGAAQGWAYTSGYVCAEKVVDFLNEKQ